MAELNLDEIRQEINQINDEMLSLFIRRMELSARVARYKKERGLPTLDRKREEAILQAVSDATPLEYRPYAIQLFKSIMEQSRDYQDTMR